jgi:hypothetical protein
LSSGWDPPAGAGPSRGWQRPPRREPRIGRDWLRRGLLAALGLGLVGTVAWLVASGEVGLGGTHSLEVEPAAAQTPSPSEAATDPNGAASAEESAASPSPQPATAAGEWRRLAPAPVEPPTEAYTGVWTGERLYVWGAGGRELAAFDPADGQWRASLPKWPIEQRVDFTATWTGEQILVWGGRAPGANESAFVDGAVYDPQRRRWQPMPAAPLEPRQDPAVVWTGDELVVWGGEPTDGDSQVGGAAYDPQNGTWRRLPEAPAPASAPSAGVWTGQEVLFVGEDRGGGEADRPGDSFALAYAPSTGAWRRLPSPPLDDPAQANPVWTGSKLVLWGVPADGTSQAWTPPLAGAAYDRASGRWRVLPEAPGVRDRSTRLATFGLSTVWTGERMLIYGGYPSPTGLSYRPGLQRWAELVPDGRPVVQGVAAWTGKRLLVWGGYSSDGPSAALSAWRPDG